MTFSAALTASRNSPPKSRRCRSYQEIASSMSAAAAGRRTASGAAFAQPAINLFPGNSGRPLGLQLIEPAIQFLALSRGHGHCVRVSAKAVPDFLEELEALLRAEAGNVDHGHRPSIAAMTRRGLAISH